MRACRLYHCLKCEESNLGVTVLDISREGQEWERKLKTIFFDPNLCTRCAPFKGVSDIVLIGKNGLATTVSVSEEDVYSCMSITSAITATEVV